MEELHYYLHIRLAKNEIFFGPGVLTLLTLTQECESLSAAAKSMDLSYSKACKMIKGAETALGFKLLDRKIGGAGGGGSKLKPEAIEFMEKYASFLNELNSHASESFVRYFSKYI